MVGVVAARQLRRGACLEADVTCVMAHDKPLPLYRAFCPLASSTNVAKALVVLSGPLLNPELTAWLDD